MIQKDYRGHEVIKYGRKFSYGNCNSLDSKISDLVRLYYAMIVTCSQAIKGTGYLTAMFSENLSDSDDSNNSKLNIFRHKKGSFIGAAAFSAAALMYHAYKHV